VSPREWRLVGAGSRDIERVGREVEAFRAALAADAVPARDGVDRGALDA
jgi:hypothetical protein